MDLEVSMQMAMVLIHSKRLLRLSNQEQNASTVGDRAMILTDKFAPKLPTIKFVVVTLVVPCSVAPAYKLVLRPLVQWRIVMLLIVLDGRTLLPMRHGLMPSQRSPPPHLHGHRPNQLPRNQRVSLKLELSGRGPWDSLDSS